MREQLVTFKTAKLAQEKGFKLPCSNSVNKEGHESSLDWNGEQYFTEDDILDAKGNTGEDHFLAPTQSILQKWLRELPTPLIVTPTTDFVAWEVEIVHPDKGTLIFDKNIDGKWFNSYEEALEVGLSNALELFV